MELIGVCKGPTVDDVKKNLDEIQGDVDGIELRLDLFEVIDLKLLKNLLLSWNKKVILTFHNKESEEFLFLWQQLLDLAPDYVDLCWDCPDVLLSYVQKHSCRPKIILSYHNFIKTPDLDQIYLQMQEKRADIYKMACLASSTTDALKMLTFCYNTTQQGKPFIGIAMGEFGKITRILAAVVGSYFSYVHIHGHQTALGQLDLKDFPSLSKRTKVYGLIGENIEKSLSPDLHNTMFSLADLDAIYIKFPLKIDELGEFFMCVNSLPFIEGLSVTTPFKERCIYYLDEISSEAVEINSVNTVRKVGGTLLGFNTDAPGSVLAVRPYIMKDFSRVLVLGSGPAARAVAYGLVKEGMKVDIACRDVSKVVNEKLLLQTQLLTISDVDLSIYDVIINGTSTDMPVKITDNITALLAMDVNYMQGESSFLSCFDKIGVKTINGLPMLVHQAVLQQQIWENDLQEVDLITLLLSDDQYRNALQTP
ncbi:MAG: type I 3-dehydroquinate dehydratase [Chlamydiae bacterium]|nr:type I 3-dehydroquinate dehydratase [Chlamydiota bacterium]